jgi:hypothetical protein
MKKHLVITTAHFSESECIHNGFDYNDRIREHTESFQKINNIKNEFDSITIVETRSFENLDYLEKTGFDIFLSKKPNYFLNKGLNEIFHMKNFIDSNQNIAETDLIVKLSGRYKIENDNLLKYTDFDCVAKNDLDIYDSGKGVHTFYYSIRKKTFNEFYNHVSLDFNNNYYKKDICLEWELKDFLLKSEKCLILPKDEKIGVTTCIFFNKEWIKKYC